MSTADGEPRAGAGPDRGRPDGRHVALLVAAVVLAGAAVVAVVLVDDARWLRLGVVAALWAALLAVFLVTRRSPARAGEDAGDDRLEALRRRHERELSAEAAAREDEVAAARRDAESRRQEEIVALREEVARLRSHADAVTVQPLEVRPARLRVVGEGSPPPRRTATHSSAPPPVDRPHHLRPAPPVGPAAVAPPSAPPPAALRPPRADPPLVATGSFVDQYVREARPDLTAEVPARAPVRNSAANRLPSAGWDQPAATTGRTVAELLAAHAAAGGTGGRRRRDER